MKENASTPPTGLTSAEVAERTARGEGNRVRRSDAAEYRDILARNTLTLFNALVVPAALALFFLHEYRGGVAVSGMALTNMVLGLVQEIRAKWHLDRLALLTETRVRVIRDGLEQEIPSGDVVRGDLLVLRAGEPVVADGPVHEARFLEVDEALLTGESDPVPRHPGESLLSGSFCVAGEGTYLAEHVGAESFAQRTAVEARAYRHVQSPLQQHIDQLIRILTATAVLLCAFYVLFLFLGHVSRLELVEMVAATITSMVPQGLVLMTTISFTLSAVRLSRQGALVQMLPAVEAMAGIDTLCLDKTGTLTTGRLVLAEVKVVSEAAAEEEVRRFLRLFVTLSVDRDSKSLEAIRQGLGEAEGERLDQLPFKSQNRYSAVRLRANEQEHTLVLGACEALRPLLAEAGHWEEAWQKLLPTGLRLMLFAEVQRREGEPIPSFTGTLDERNLRPLALVGLRDELRPEAQTVLHQLAEQGIQFKVLSGDHPETVRATVMPFGQETEQPRLRALAEAEVVTGTELDASPDPGSLIAERVVFGRVAPHQKVQVVRTLQEQGRRVAMLGDGVNDVLPIKTADLGIAMGEGSRASKTVAGLVLENNDFRLLPQALDEGRSIVRNIRRAAKLFLTKNAYTLLLIVGALALFHLPFPYMPQQVTLLNLLTIGLPALWIALRRDPSPPRARVNFLRDVLSFAIENGVALAAVGLVGMRLASTWVNSGQEVLREEMQRTMLLSLLITLGWVVVWRVAREGKVDWTVLLPVLLGVPIYLTAMYWSDARYFFELVALNLWQWGRVLTGVAVTWSLLLLLDLGRWWLNKDK
jgi:cation-transporting ATPase E